MTRKVHISHTLAFSAVAQAGSCGHVLLSGIGKSATSWANLNGEIIGRSNPLIKRKKTVDTRRQLAVLTQWKYLWSRQSKDIIE